MDDHGNSGPPAAKYNCAPTRANNIAPELRGQKRGGKPSRAEHFKHLEVNLPSPTPTQSMSEAEPVPEAPAPIYTDYPRLRTKLRDLGLPFQAKFNQVETAQIIGVSDHTVRDWTKAGKMHFCRTPFGRLYYIPQNIEDHLTECEGPRPRTAAR